MEEKEIILSKWLEGKVTDEEVKAIYDDIDLDYLKGVLAKQEKFSITKSDSQKQWNKIESILKPKELTSPIKIYLKYLLLLIFAGIATSALYFLIPENKTYIKPNKNEFRNHAFIDGSTARLWPGSTLVFDDSTYVANRYIELEGQAFFDVKKGSPFTVKTQSGEVKVLGTSFDVWSPDKTSTLVKCHTGRVKVLDKNKQEVILTPGKKVIIEDNKIGKIIDFNLDLQNNSKIKKYYDDAKVSWVVDDLANLYGASIELDNEIKNQRINGLIVTNDLNLAISYLCETMNWSYVQKGKHISIRSKD